MNSLLMKPPAIKLVGGGVIVCEWFVNVFFVGLYKYSKVLTTHTQKHIDTVIDMYLPRDISKVNQYCQPKIGSEIANYC